MSRAFHRMITTLAALVMFLVAAVGADLAFAVYPEKPIRLIVPFTPGGGTDIIARTLASGMGKEVAQPVVVENKAGGGTVIGTDAVAKSAPDGYTLLVATFAHAVNPSMQPKLPYVWDKAFAPVILIGRGPNVLVVRSDGPYRTIRDIITAATRDPGKLTYASFGNGTSAHLAGEMFTNLAHVQMTHVPYRGMGAAVTDIMGGQVDMIFGTAAGVAGYLTSGQLRAIAVTSPQRSASLAAVAATRPVSSASRAGSA